MKNRAKWFWWLSVILISGYSMGMPVYGDATADEIKLGKEGAVEIEKQYKLVDDKEKIKNLQEMLDKVAAASEEPKLTYTVKILDTKDVNAISLPGGPVYVTKGLLGYAESDHEMAAVLAHEIAHIAKHHMVKLIKRESRMNAGMIWVMLAAVVSGQYESEGFQGAMLGAQLLKIAKVNGYGQTLETEADMGGLEYMTKAGFNPVGMLTFMERLAATDSRKARMEMGIYQTHPESAIRARALEKKLDELGIRINRREVVASKQAQVKISTVDGKEVAEVVLNGEVIFKPAETEPGKPNKLRAEAIASQINSALSEGAQMFEVTVENTNAGAAVKIRGKTAMEVLKSDVTDSVKSPRSVADDAAQKIRRVLWKEAIDRAY